MFRVRKNDLAYYQFDNLRYCDGVTHGIFTRRGGISQAPFDSLNVGAMVGDDPEHVEANRRTIAAVAGAQVEDTRTIWQTHSSWIRRCSLTLPPVHENNSGADAPELFSVPGKATYNGPTGSRSMVTTPGPTA